MASAKLSTHVLDTASGRPAKGVRLELWRIDPQPRLLKALETNADGRTDAPLLSAPEMEAGTYQIVFFVGAYFRSHGMGNTASQLPFLDEVPVRFSIGNPSVPYHIPLLVSPWAYSTYRGS